MSISTCQFCEKFNGHSGKSSGRKQPKYNGKVKYGPRHYAHFECFLDAKGIEALGKLHGWQINQFPALLIKERGIENEVKQAIAKAEGK